MTDSTEGPLAHIANAIQPLLILTAAPTLFSDQDIRDCIASAQVRLERAVHALNEGGER